jgi:hypothetical protein
MNHNRACASVSATVVSEGTVEEQLGLSPRDGLTCPVRRRRLHQCVSLPEHAIRVTGHRWCRRCDRPLNAAVDEFLGSVTFECATCRRFPHTAANRQILRFSWASLDAARPDRARPPAVAGVPRAA